MQPNPGQQILRIGHRMGVEEGGGGETHRERGMEREARGRCGKGKEKCGGQREV